VLNSNNVAGFALAIKIDGGCSHNAVLVVWTQLVNVDDTTCILLPLITVGS